MTTVVNCSEGCDGIAYISINELLRESTDSNATGIILTII